MTRKRKTIRLSSWLSVTVAVFELRHVHRQRISGDFIDGVYDAMTVILVIYRDAASADLLPVSSASPFGFAQETPFILIKGSS